MQEAKAWAITVDLRPHSIAKTHGDLNLVADCNFDFSDPDFDDFLMSVGAIMSRPDPSTFPIDLVWEEMKAPDGASVGGDAGATQLDTSSKEGQEELSWQN